MAIVIGDPIELAFRISIDGIPQTGRTIQVRVVKVADGSELLASIANPATAEDGLYTYIWTTPPTERIQIMVVYKDVGTGKSFVEFLFIEERKEKVIVEIEGTVTTSAGVEDTVLGIVEDIVGVSGVVEGDEMLSVNIDEGASTALVEGAEIAGAVIDGDISGTVECD